MSTWLLTGLLVAQTATAAAAQDSRPSFTEFLDGVRQEALARGIRSEIVDAALMDIHEPAASVIERDRSQAETVLSLETYVRRLLTPRLIQSGRDAFATHRMLLNKVADTYGVPAGIIAAVWGIESNFGRFSGVRPTIAALATLAWDPRRSALFRNELFAALEILNRGDIDLAQLKGSWAGAMGQTQFIPSSYLQYAEDFDNDGRRDIWSSPGDIFASIANYLKGKGWIAGQTWGREVRVPAEALTDIQATVARRSGRCQATRDMTVSLSMDGWQRLGVRLPDGGPLPLDAPDASLVSGTTRHFLVYHNYDALLEYNCSHSYAISVAQLGQQLAGDPAAPAAKPKGAPRKRASKAKKSSTPVRPQ